MQTFLLVLSLLGSVNSCKSYTDSLIASYDFTQLAGEVILDLSGNSYHGINGGSFGGSQAGTPTDRGIFFTANEYAVLGSLVLAQNTFDLVSSFTVLIWANFQGEMDLLWTDGLYLGISDAYGFYVATSPQGYGAIIVDFFFNLSRIDIIPFLTRFFKDII